MKYTKTLGLLLHRLPGIYTYAWVQSFIRINGNHMCFELNRKKYPEGWRPAKLLHYARQLERSLISYELTGWEEEKAR